MPTQAPDDAHLGTAPDGVGVAIDQAAPDATLEDADGKEVRLTSVLGKRPTLVVFYRGGWCPFCNYQIHALSEAWPEFQKRGVGLVAISVDRPAEASKTRALYRIPFPVLSDPELALHRAFRVIHHANDDEFAALKKMGLDLESASGKTHHDIAIPSMFFIDAEGIVRWAHADPAYKVRPSLGQVLWTLDRVADRAR
jgi:peroxiredoxin